MKEAQTNLNEKLLTEFVPPTYEEWQAAVETTLKGKPFEKAMFTKTYEDITLQPIYRLEDIEGLAHLDLLPGDKGSARSGRKTGYLDNSWSIAQEQTDYLPEDVNKTLLDELNRGLTKVNLRVDYQSAHGMNPAMLEGSNRYVGTSITTLKDLKTALEGVALENIEVDIKCGIMAPAYLAMFNAIAQEKNVAIEKLSGCIGLDPISVLVKDGILMVDLNQSFDYMAEMTKWAVANAPKVKTILVDTSCYGNNGANSVQELALALNTASLYINAMMERGIKFEDVVKHIQFNITVGQRFFTEIAKFRAFKILWSNFISAYVPECKQPCYIHAMSTQWNKTKFDPYVNILRNATETFSAVLGGIDSLEISHLDNLLARPTSFTRRIARNQQIIIGEESNVCKIVDPAGGSWYIEKLTADLSEKVWEQFQTYEAEGGILTSLKNDIIQDDVIGVANAKVKNVATRKDVILGTNMYSNLIEEKINFDENVLNEQIQSRINKFASTKCSCGCSCGNDCEHANSNEIMSLDAMSEALKTGTTIATLFPKMWKGAEITAITKIPEMRSSMQIEALRTEVESMTATPSVFLANFGPIPQHKPRADFAKGFFEVGALNVITNQGFQVVDEMVKATLESKAQNVCICSTDKAYPEFVPEFVQKLKEQNSSITVLLAGYPKDCIDAFKEAGVDEFIHVKANCYQILKNLIAKVGA